MVTIEEMQAMLDEIAESLPRAFYKQLNGGIILLPQKKLSKNAIAGDLFILGEYHRDANLGRFIAIYYGSFVQVYGNLSKERLKEKLTSTLKHEFLHHLESLAGERELEIEDARNIEEYLRKYKFDK